MQGMEAAAARLSNRPRDAVIGLNLGANKDSDDRAEDFARVLAHCGPHLDFATVNVSSPNTENLRDLQGAEALAALLRGVMEARDWLPTPIPVFLKIAPDLSDAELSEIADVAREARISGIIATNTTLDRDGLISPAQVQSGGLSGRPLFEKSTRVLARLSLMTDGEMPLIGVGGVASAAEAYAKIRAGASAVQLYSALVYDGLSLAGEIALGLDTLLSATGSGCGRSRGHGARRLAVTLPQAGAAVCRQPQTARLFDEAYDLVEARPAAQLRQHIGPRRRARGPCRPRAAPDRRRHAARDRSC